jgi:transposase-like protein
MAGVVDSFTRAHTERRSWHNLSQTWTGLNRFRESHESWADLLCDCRRRGMRAPIAVGDGALGFWKALREVFPRTKEQRCWFHKQANALAALPKSAHPGALAAMKEIYNAEDADVLLEFFHCPAEHWIHLRTTNPIESTFATVRLRSKVTKGPGSRAAGLAMAFKLIEAAEARWRAVNAPHLVALVRAGAVVKKGKLIERPVDSSTTKEAA